MAARKRSIGTRITELSKLRAQIKEKQDVVNTLKKQQDTLEAEMIQVLDDSGTTLASSPNGTASINETEVAMVDNWDSAIQWMRKTNNLHMIQRRVSNPAYRELIANRRGRGIPGLKTFVKRALSLRASK